MRYLTGSELGAKEGDVGGAEVSGDGGADDVKFGVEPAEPCAPAVGLQPQERPDRQAYVRPLDRTPPREAALHPAVLLDPLVVLLDPPRVVPPPLPLNGRHLPVVTRPVFHAAVSGDHPEHLDRP